MRRWSWPRERLSSRTTEALLSDLSDLLSAGIDIELGLRLLAEQSGYRKTIGVLHAHVLRGEPLGSALGEAGINDEVQAFLEVGQVTGDMAQALRLAAQYLGRKRLAFEQAIKLGSYPALMIVLTALVLYLLAALVIPAFARMYLAMRIHESLSLVILFALARVITVWTLPVLLVICTAITVVYATRRKIALRLRLLAMKGAVLRGWIQLFYSHRVMHLFSFLLQGGVDVLRAIYWLEEFNIASLGKQFCLVREHLLEGETLSRSFAEIAEIAPMALHMLALGERTGDVVGAVMQVADFLERARLRRQERVARVIEPVVTVILGGAVGGVTLLLMLPMMDLISQLS